MPSDDKLYSAKDVQNTAGLTYRQLNDWESRGTLPHGRAEDGGWRRFSPLDIFVLMVTKEIQSRFGVPLQRLKWMQEFMLQEGANHLEASARLMAMLGVGVWLLTDLEETFIIDSELEMLSLMEMGFFGGEKDAGYLLLKLNPVINRMLSALKDPIEIPADGHGYNILHQIREMFAASNDGERKVLEAIKSGDFRRIEVHLVDGEVRTIRTLANRPTSSGLSELLGEHDYQKVSVVMRDGRVVSVEQQVTLKIADTPLEANNEEEAPHVER
ncbi:MAG: MerR family transcriptional regulator [Acidobacteria bacterium]|nr:MerR family transcriptional regulator [Acidobacteriota bacterium]